MSRPKLYLKFDRIEKDKNGKDIPIYKARRRDNISQLQKDDLSIKEIRKVKM